jgi:hypothetical protein
MPVKAVMEFLVFLRNYCHKGITHFDCYTIEESSSKEYYSMTFHFSRGNAKFQDCVILYYGEGSEVDMDEIKEEIRDIFSQSRKIFDE